MKTTSLLLFFIAFITLSFKSDANDENCHPYFPFDEGTRWVMESFNPKGKLESSVATEVLKITETNEGIAYTIKAEPLNEKKDTASLVFTYVCENGTFKIDMNKMLPEETLKQLGETVEIQVDQSEMEFPTDLHAGQKLKDATVTLKAFSNGIRIMNMTVKIYDRVVEKAESITTKAGTFDCLKLNYKTNLVMGFLNQTTSTSEWLSKSVGMVRSEYYNKKGKLESYSELAEYKR